MLKSIEAIDTTKAIDAYTLQLIEEGIIIMRALVNSIKRLYESGRLTKEQVAERVVKGTLDEAEYEEITGEAYAAKE